MQLYIHPSRSICSAILKNRMKSSIFSPPGLYSARYSTSDGRALYSALQVYIQQYIQNRNVELYIQPSRSIFVAILKTECRLLYSSLQVYIQHYIEHPNLDLYIRLSRSIFSTIFDIRIKTSIFGSLGLYSALYSTSEWTALCSALQVFIEPLIQKSNVELYVQPSRSIFSTIFNIRI